LSVIHTVKSELDSGF